MTVGVSEEFSGFLENRKFGTILADPPWQFTNRTGKMAPEHKRLSRYATLTLKEILALPVAEAADEQSHLYLWVPNALLAEGMEVLKTWGFIYKTNLIWHKIRKDGGPDGRGVGFYFRNTTEMILFGVRGSLRTLPPGRRQVNVIRGPYLELFARGSREGWVTWGNQAEEYAPSWPTYANHSQSESDLSSPIWNPSLPIEQTSLFKG
ncbi:MAG: MT-A70 family methyltransferase [SAR324 cluster bacterium]|nr:MT-A70 family methyltransferase [SAR324 cluster bacterium]